MIGNIANLIILREKPGQFSKRTCFYLRALSITDILYLLFMIGYLNELFVLRTENYVSWGFIYYIINWSTVLSNTFITSSSGIILLLTIDYYYQLHDFDMACRQKQINESVLNNQNIKSDDNTPKKQLYQPFLYVILTVISSFLLLLPRFMEFTIVEECFGISLNQTDCVCDNLGRKYQPFGDGMTIILSSRYLLL